VGSINVAENKRLFHHYLLLAGFTERDVGDALRSSSFEMTAALFGSERALPSLGQETNPITLAEIDAEVGLYSDFAHNFSRTSASDPEISYVIVPMSGEPDLRNLDKWYLRDQGTAREIFAFITSLCVLKKNASISNAPTIIPPFQGFRCCFNA
jgi:hypothetical protein